MTFKEVRYRGSLGPMLPSLRAHSAHVPECARSVTGFTVSRTWYAGFKKSNALVDRRPVPHHAGRRWQSARAVGTHTAYAGSMGGLSPVPFGRWRDAWRDRRPRTLPYHRARSCYRLFAFGSLLSLPEMEAAGRHTEKFSSRALQYIARRAFLSFSGRF